MLGPIGKGLGKAWSAVVSKPSAAVANAVAGAVVGRLAKSVAEGQRGEFARRTYWWIAGKKRIIGAVLFAIAGAAEATGNRGVIEALSGTLGAALVAAGFVDAEYRKGVPDDVRSLGWYRWMSAHAHGTGAVFEVLAAVLATCPSWASERLALAGTSCEQAMVALGFVGLAFVQLGFMSAARLVTPPSIAAAVTDVLSGKDGGEAKP